MILMSDTHIKKSGIPENSDVPASGDAHNNDTTGGVSTSGGVSSSTSLSKLEEHDTQCVQSGQWRFETRQIHSGQTPDSSTHSRAVPIYQTASYTFESSEHAADLFALAKSGYTYTRTVNPTQSVLESRMSDLEGGVVTKIGAPGALMVSSGQASEALAILNIAEAGDHVVSSASLYGGSYSLLSNTITRLGIDVTFVADPHDIDEWASAVRPNTKLFYGEVFGNPGNDYLDIQEVAKLAHDCDAPLIIDNTTASPYLVRPLEHGADIVLHSATKYIGGHGTSIGGVIIDGGSFDFGASGRFTNYTAPDPVLNGRSYWGEFGPGAFIIKARTHLLRDIGPSISPFNVFLLLQGIETLSLRMERHCSNAQAVAQHLESRPEVEQVFYAGLPSHPTHKRAKEITQGRGYGAIPSFILSGGRSAGQRFVDALDLHSHVANLGDVRSLVIHPASTTHAQLTEDEQALAGVYPGLVRLSVGIEHIDDILADLELGFAAL